MGSALAEVGLGVRSLPSGRSRFEAHSDDLDWHYRVRSIVL